MRPHRSGPADNGCPPAPLRMLVKSPLLTVTEYLASVVRSEGHGNSQGVHESMITTN